MLKSNDLRFKDYKIERFWFTLFQNWTILIHIFSKLKDFKSKCDKMEVNLIQSMTKIITFQNAI